MNITYLKYALEVERTGSISRAADALYTSQPHISKAIRELESAVGISLFYRTPRGAAPTEEGLVFLQRARELLTQLEDLEMSYRKTKNASQRFSLSAPRALAAPLPLSLWRSCIISARIPSSGWAPAAALI